MLSYNFVRSGELTSRELHLLTIINSYSGESHLKLAQYAEMMRASIRTVKRVIKSLKEKGFVTIRYGLYKSLHVAVCRLSNILWKPNDKKNLEKSKGPKWSFKRAIHGTSNIERNKEINKGVRYPIFKEETLDLSDEMPVQARSMLDNLKNKLGIS